MSSSVGKLLTIQEAAERLRVRPSWFYQKIHGRSLPFLFLKVGMYVRIPEEELETYIQKQLQK